MNRSDAELFTLRVDGAHTVSGLLSTPPHPRACYVLAHGGGGRNVPPIHGGCGNGTRRIATLRYQFPFMEQGAKRPDAPKLAHATVRAAVAEARRLLPALPLVAGGKSFGGRMTSQAQAASALPGVRGLAFLGFPLHPAGSPSDERAQHLFEIDLPMLFLQGTRDKLADVGLLQGLRQRLGARASLQLFENADHSFRVPARGGRKDAQVTRDMMDTLAAWTFAVISRRD